MKTFFSLACTHRFPVIAALASLVLISTQAGARKGGGQKTGVHVISCALPAVSFQELSPTLRYKWQPKTSYVYSVHIEADIGAEIETEDGNLVYDVRAVNDVGTTLGWRGALTPQIRSKDGRPRPYAGLRTLALFHAYGFPAFPTFGRPNEMQITAQGIRLDTQGQQPLPRAMGDLPALPIELLPDAPKPTWAYGSDCVVTVRTSRGLTPMIPRPFPRPNLFGHGSLLNREAENEYPAHEDTTYKFERMEGANAIITKHYNLSTRARLRAQPLIELVSDGQFTFDTNLGVPRALSFKASLINNLQGDSRSTPLTVTYRLLEGAERERALAPPPPATQLGNPSGNPPNNPLAGQPNNPLTHRPNIQPGTGRGMLNDAEINHQLQELRSPEAFPRHIAADRIAQSEPNPRRRAEVITALKPLLNDADEGVRTAAIKAVAAWAEVRDSRTNAELVRLLDDNSVFIRWATLDALGTRGTPQTAAGVARVLKKERLVGMNSLRHMGAVAAPALIPLLQDEDTGLRADACRLLKDVGIKNSLRALQQIAAKDSDDGVRREAQTAIDAIEKRLQASQPNSETQ